MQELPPIEAILRPSERAWRVAEPRVFGGHRAAIFEILKRTHVLARGQILSRGASTGPASDPDKFAVYIDEHFRCARGSAGAESHPGIGIEARRAVYSRLVDNVLPRTTRLTEIVSIGVCIVTQPLETHFVLAHFFLRTGAVANGCAFERPKTAVWGQYVTHGEAMTA